MGEGEAQDPSGTPIDVWADSAGAWATGGVDGGREAFRRHLMRDLSQRVHRRKDQPTPTCLDLGCRTGHSTAMLVRHGFAARGLDRSAAQVAAARAANPGLVFEEGDAQDVAHPANAFDTAATFGLIESVPDWWRVVLEALRVVKPGGYALVETDLAFPWWETILRAVAGVASRQRPLREAWDLARAHWLAAGRSLDEGPRRYSRRDMLDCVAPLPVLQVILHEPGQNRLFHEPMWAVTLMKREHEAQAGVPPLVVTCAHCHRRGIRPLREGRG
ncbi:MAG: class I SAM-dependent methyltransferase [Lentisphaerae bacterium]|nr:class I SAM-dependent methyltransferase [Lentisphaerota bacterium]